MASARKVKPRPAISTICWCTSVRVLRNFTSTQHRKACFGGGYHDVDLVSHRGRRILGEYLQGRGPLSGFSASSRCSFCNVEVGRLVRHWVLSCTFWESRRRKVGRALRRLGVIPELTGRYLGKRLRRFLDDIGSCIVPGMEGNVVPGSVLPEMDGDSGEGDVGE